MNIHEIDEECATSWRGEGLQSYLDNLVLATGIPGISVSVACGEKIIAASSGSADIARSLPLGEHSRFGIVCLGRLLVALAILQLVESGDLSLDATIADYLPELFDPIRPKAKYIKLRHLLSHTSGYRGLRLDETTIEMSWKEGAEFFRLAPQLFSPGRVFSEEHFNYVLLGQIAKRVTGKEICDLIDQNILRPLKISPFRYHVDNLDNLLVSGHMFSPEKRIWEMYKVGRLNELWEPAVSNIAMSTRDLATLGFELGPHGTVSRGLFSAKLLGMLFESRVNLPLALSSKRHTEWNVAAFGHGYAKFRNGHWGFFSAGRGQCHAMVFHGAADIAVATALNAQSGPLRTTVLNHLFDRISGRESGNAFRPPTLPDSDMDFGSFLNGFTPRQLAGSYLGSSNVMPRVDVRGNRIKITTGAGRTFTLVPLQRNRVMMDANNAESVAFFPDQAGRPVLMLGMRAYLKIGKVATRS